MIVTKLFLLHPLIEIQKMILTSMNSCLQGVLVICTIFSAYCYASEVNTSYGSSNESAPTLKSSLSSGTSN